MQERERRRANVSTISGKRRVRSLPGGLEPDDWALMRRVLDLIKANVPTDSNAGPGEVFDVIENALRAHYAKPIEGAA